ncbi:hypothetical protein POTOM_035641 [Populus tomentosa]|uniref:Tetratricopeptide repeat-like superfamily protein n=1 Tax=Populus tomentosa TaxID=118781 RepID=A0A8X8CME1_POPTO|nr:hypothetical protein POTOM_035641 [Populus tomentosa]
MLLSSPSLSIFNKNEGPEDEEQSGLDMGTEEELMRTITIGENIESIGSGDFSFGKKSMGLIEEEGEEQKQGSDGIENFDNEEVKDPASPSMYLAGGLGIDDIDFGGDSGGCGGGFHLSFPNFDEGCDAEEYFKKMIDEYPCHPLLLSNYARFLQSKGELRGAEEYYHLATLADPTDSEILMQYAKLEWELNHDQGRALVNFERAVQAAPQNSDVLAAYVSFLWEIEDDGEGDTSQPEYIQLPSELNIDVEDHAASDANEGGSAEEYCMRMVEENPCNSLVLKNYAEFLYQSKRDLEGAEEYYSRAILADPSDGETLSQYAKLVWELYHDHDKALSFYEQAAQATPSDRALKFTVFSWKLYSIDAEPPVSFPYKKENIHYKEETLSKKREMDSDDLHDIRCFDSYASFLWETEENEEDSTSQFQILNHHEGAAAAANA